MNLLQSLLAESANVNVYYGHVKRALKKDPKFAAGKISRGAIASVVHDIAENDPDSKIDTKAIINGVFAKYKAAHAAKAKRVAEGIDELADQGPTEAPSNLSSKDRSFDPAPEGGDGMDPDMEDEGGDSEVEELKALRTKDIGDTLTPEQKEELERLRAECDDECQSSDMDSDISLDKEAGIDSGSDMDSMKDMSSAARRMAESRELCPMAKAAMKRKAAKGGPVEAKTEEEEVPAKKKTIGRDLQESAARAKRLEELSTSILANVTRKEGSFLK